MIVIIDYGMGNVGSIYNMIRKISSNVIISSEHNEILKAKKLILPGVGSFDTGIKNLRKLDLISLLNKKVDQEKTPVLGICLGMQLMTHGSEEGSLDGLGWIHASTVKFAFDELKKIKIPHMGWNYIEIKKQHDIVDDLPEKPRYYFVHSYHVQCHHKSDILTSTYYNCNFTSAFQKGNIIGVQFHPEKSHKYGLKLMRNFVELN